MASFAKNAAMSAGMKYAPAAMAPPLAALGWYHFALGRATGEYLVDNANQYLVQVFLLCVPNIIRC